MNIDDLFKAPPPKRKGDIFSQLPPPKHLKTHLFDTSEKSSASQEFDTSDSSPTHTRRKNQNGEGEDEEEEEDSRFYADGLTAEERKILDLVDQAENAELVALDLPTLKRMVARLEKAYVRNQELRHKYVNEPTRFMDSELDLDSEIRALSNLAATPHLYHTAELLGLPALFIQTLSHENSDIRLAVVEVLSEITDEDVLQPEKDDDKEEDQELLENIRSFIHALIEQNLLQVLETSYRGEDEEENQWKYFTLLDNLLTAGLQLSESLVESTQFLHVFIQGLKNPQYTANLGYKVELLAMTLQESIPAREKMIKEGGMDLLLRALSQYRKRDPQDSDQIEFMANIFDILCACLSESAGMESFRNEEGIELMLLIVKAQCRARIQAVRALNYATLPYTDQGRLNCLHFVRHKGMDLLFQVFMRKDQKALIKAYKLDYQVQSDEENIICLISNIVRALITDESPHFNDLLKQFCEHRHERLINLTTLFANYYKKLAAVDLPGKDDEQVFLDKLEKGFFSLFHLALLIGMLFQADQECKEYLSLFLERIGASIETILEVLEEYAQHAADQDGFLKKLIEHLDNRKSS